MRPKVQRLREPIRLSSLDVIKRKTVALQSGVADQVGAVFNETERELASLRLLRDS